MMWVWNILLVWMCIYPADASILEKTDNSTATFQLILESPETIFEATSLYISDSDDRIYISKDINSENLISCHIDQQGYLLLDGTLTNYIGVAIGKNYLYPIGNHGWDKLASPFSIKDGYLKLYSHDFHAVPSGMDGIYVIGSINAAAGRSDVFPIRIRAHFSSAPEKLSFNPPQYTGKSATISINTVPFMHHHTKQEMSETTLNMDRYNVMFYFLDSIL